MKRYALLLCSLLSAVSTWAAEPRKPNVILFLVDDMGWMDSGAYGSKYYETPHMDRLAQQAMRFNTAYSQPLCSPTRASILSGQYSARHGITSASRHQPPQPPGHDFLRAKAAPNQPLLMPESKNYLEPSQITLAEALRTAGYRTAHIGKWHLGLTQPHWPEQQGFDVAFHCHPDPGPPGGYFSPYGVLPPGTEKPKAKAGEKFVTGTITDGPPGEYITDRVTDEALKFIEQHASTGSAQGKEQPFFLNLWQYGVHGPWGYKEAYATAFAGKPDPTGRQGNAIMAAMLRSVDESLGRILAKLEELKLADNTILVFYSDNGGNVHSNTPDDRKQANIKPGHPRYDFVQSWKKLAGDRPPTNNEPLRNGKGRLYEGGVRVPLMVRWPGKIPAGTTSDAMVGCIDLYPTLLDLAGVPLPAAQKVDGRSFAPVLKQTGPFPRDTYFIWFPHLVPGVIVRQGDWKLIRRFEARPAEYEGLHELFNLKDDLGETNNLAAKLPDKVKALDALIDQFVKDTGALYPVPNPDYKPRAAVAKSAAAAPADPLVGLVPKLCKATLIAGAVRIEADGRTPFLGTAQVKLAGPLTLKLRARSSAGGAGKVAWKTAEQAEFPKDGQVVAFTLPAGADWQEVTVALPIQGQPGIIRLHLPADQAPVEIQSIQYTGRGGQTKAWNFQKVQP